MFVCDHKTLRLSFNKFHNAEDKEKPEYGELCLLELSDGRLTAGACAFGDDEKSGKYIRGFADSIALEEVSKWHTLDRDDLSNCLEEDINWINIGEETEDGYSVQLENFKSFSDGDRPKNEQYCLLILTDGCLSAGRWDDDIERFEGWGSPNKYRDDVWAWTALSPDTFSEQEEEWENEQKQEEELNRNPVLDPKLFKYGTDITDYYEKALNKLRVDYPWATLTQMLKKTQWDIVPLHGRYVFGQVSKGWRGTTIVNEWTDGSTADEFIDFLCEYVKEPVKNSNPGEKFKYGMDIEVYFDKAYKNVKRDYRWLDKKMLKKYCRYAIQQIDGEWEFVKAYKGDKEYFICDVDSADSFIKDAEYAFKSAALDSNPVVAEYKVKFGRIEVNGWYLEKYDFARRKTGDYTVTVQAGDRVTGGTREFFIPPDCFKTKSYEEFLDRYLEIVPGGAFGLYKKDLLSDTGLKEFLGY